MEDPVERAIDEMTERPFVLDPSKFLKDNLHDRQLKYFLHIIFERIKETQDKTFEELEKIIGSDFSGAVQDAMGKASFIADKYDVDGAIYHETEEDLMNSLATLVKKSKKTVVPGEED